MKPSKILSNKGYVAMGATIIAAMVLIMTPEQWLVFDLKILLTILIVTLFAESIVKNNKSIFNLIVSTISHQKIQIQNLKTDYKQLKTTQISTDEKTTEIKGKMDFLLQNGPNQQLEIKKEILGICDFRDFYEDVINQTIISYFIEHIEKFNLIETIREKNEEPMPEEIVENIIYIVNQISTSLIKNEHIPSDLQIHPLDMYINKTDTKAIIYNISKMVNDICKLIKVNINFTDIKKIFGKYLSTINPNEITKRKPDPSIYTKNNLEEYNDKTKKKLVHDIAKIVDSHRSSPKAFKEATEGVRIKKQTL